MIPNHKWVKPENYRGDLKCWISFNGMVLKGCYISDSDYVFIVYGEHRSSHIRKNDVDGLCERKDGEEKPELR